VAIVSGLVSGCFAIPPEQKARDVCTAYCDCLVAPTRVEACVVEDCLPAIQPVSDPCLDCVYASSQTCSMLFDDCTALCLGNITPLLGGL
jgi:hypothetical protein